MATWLLGALLLAALFELVLDIRSEEGGPLKKLSRSSTSVLTKNALALGLGGFLLPLGAVLITGVGWVQTFPAELLDSEAIEPYSELDYLVGPVPEGATFVETWRLRCSNMLIQAEEIVSSVEKTVQPIFVGVAKAMHWMFGVISSNPWLCLATFGLLLLGEIIFFRAVKVRGPILWILKYWFTATPKITKFEKRVLPNLFFVALGTAYFAQAFYETEQNARQKVWPLVSAWISAFRKLAVEANTLWLDSGWTAMRFFVALFVIFLAIPVGVAMARFARIDLLLHRFTLWGADKINAFAIVILVFAILKEGEHTRIFLAVMALAPTASLDAFFRASEVPPRLIHKARTFGATDTEVAFRRTFRLILPGVLNTIRLSIKSVIGILIFSETMGGNTGLGLRLGLAQRNNSIESVIVMNVTFVIGLIVVDWLLGQWLKKGFRWYQGGN